MGKITEKTYLMATRLVGHWIFKLIMNLIGKAGIQ